MARYSKKKYRKYRKFYRRYKKGGYIRSDRVVNASSRSSCSVKIKKSITFNIHVAAGSYYTDVVSLNPWVQQVWNSSFTDPFQVVYRSSPVYTSLMGTYSQLYDETKCDYFGVKVTVNSLLGFNNVATSCKLVTAWDRKGTYADTYYNAKYPVFNDINQLATAKSRTFSNFVNTPYIFDSVRASDFVEKYLWIDSSVDRYSGQVRGQNTTFYCNEAWIDATNNFLPFSPTFYFALAFLEVAPTVNVSVTFTVDMYAVYSFRNPRKGQEQSSAWGDPDSDTGHSVSSSSKTDGDDIKKAPEIDEPPLKKKKVVGKIVCDFVDPEEIHSDDEK